ncbi:MAG: ABC transporter permease [Paludibacteraceae bacterium]|nr:ABC transporter permease [Paludibacteraceae bacterium]
MANLENHIAWRYLFSKKGHNAINIVSGISAAAVMVVTAAMVCVLSVMNGFGVLVEHMFSEFDPALMVVPAEGTTLRTDTAPVVSLYAREDIEAVSMQLEQTALIRYKDHQLPARVMGVDSLFEQTAHIDSIITDGFYSVWDGAFERAVLGRGLAAQIGINAHFTGALHLYAPRRTERINLMRPDLSLLHEHAFIAGTFAVNQIDYDDQLMLVSLPLAQRLFEYDEHTASALRIQPREGVKISNLQSQIAKALGPGYRVLDRYEQQADFFRILKIEKLLTVLLLVFILLIALFNSIGSLSMLIIDKREDIRILSDLGADEPTIRRIFLTEGWLISTLGTIGGLVIGVLLCLGQQYFGWLKLGSGAEYIISAYPVQVQAVDIVLVGVIVLALGFVAAWYPTRKMKIA